MKKRESTKIEFNGSSINIYVRWCAVADSRQKISKKNFLQIGANMYNIPYGQEISHPESCKVGHTGFAPYAHLQDGGGEKEQS